MSTQLTSANLLDTAQGYREAAEELMNTRGRGRLQFELQQLIDSQAPLADINAKQQEISDINTNITRCVQKAQDLDAIAILDIIAATNVQEAMQQISQAKDKVLRAVKGINNIRRTLQYVNLFIRVAGAIVSAATTISPPAQIKAIIEAINILYEADFSEDA